MRKIRSILVGVLLVIIACLYFWRYTDELTWNHEYIDGRRRYATDEHVNLPVINLTRTCGLYEVPTVMRKIPEKQNIKGIYPLSKKVTPDLCVKTIKKRPLLPLSLKEILNIEACMKYNGNPEKLRSYSFLYFYDISTFFFSSINKNPHSIIIEIGGYVGNQAKLLVKPNVQTYVVVEPIKKFYDQLKSSMKALEGKTTFQFFNFGLGKNYSKVAINENADGTSLFHPNKLTNSKSIDVVNVIDIFVYLGVACVDVDLLNINCEGCEFEVLEMLAATNLIEKVVNIQFQPHYMYKEVGSYSCRYCRLVELLSRTHELSYRFNVIWEMWRRKYGI